MLINPNPEGAPSLSRRMLARQGGVFDVFVILVATLLLPACSRQPRIVVGCKNFTEQIILGELIFRGLAMVNNSVILAGAVPAALMALTADFVLGWLEKRFAPQRAV